MKKLIILLASIFTLSHIYAGRPEFSLELSAAYSPSETDEEVFQKDIRISWLNWNTNSTTFTYSIKSSAKWFNVLLLGEFDSGISAKAGTIIDRDYMIGDPSKISNFSKHDVYIDKDYSAGLTLGYDFKYKMIGIMPLASVCYENTKYSAQNGYLQYPEYTAWTGDEEKEHTTGTLISYESSILYPKFGFCVYAEIIPALTLNASYQYLPYIKIETLDSHYLRLGQFNDVYNNGTGNYFDINASIKLPSQSIRQAVKFGYSFKSYSAEGEAYYDSIGKKKSDFIKQQNTTTKFTKSFHKVYLSYILTL